MLDTLFLCLCPRLATPKQHHSPAPTKVSVLTHQGMTRFPIISHDNRTEIGSSASDRLMSRVYLDIDRFLASLKADDWLETAARKATFVAPQTSVEIQLVMFESWSRSEFAEVWGSIGDEGVEVVTRTAGVFAAGSELLSTYPALD